MTHFSPISRRMGPISSLVPFAAHPPHISLSMALLTNADKIRRRGFASGTILAGRLSEAVRDANHDN